MKYTVFYISGLTELHKPGQTRIAVDSKGIKVHKQFIGWDTVRDAQVKYEVVNKSGSVGGAIVGGALAGTVGAIAGSSMNEKGVDTYFHIIYTVGDQEYELIMIGAPAATYIQKKLVKLITQRGKVDSQLSKASEDNHKQWKLFGQLWGIYKWPWVVMLRFLRIILNHSR